MGTPMKTPYAAAGFFLLTLGCASADRSEVVRERPAGDRQTAAARQCVPLETRAWFSCWRSASNAPLTHCVAYAEDDPACELKAQGGAYLSRGAPSGGTPAVDAPAGWVLVPVFADEGRVGMATTRVDGTRYLQHHNQSPPPTDAPSPPQWPRWPSGLEFGPEQTQP